MIDIAIIGSGPAALSAAVNGVQRNKTVTVLGKSAETGQLYRAERIDNYLGLPGLSGRQMLDAFREHANALRVDMKEGRVTQILSMGDYFAAQFGNDILEAKTVILATGLASGKQIEGEAAYLGKGVSYCATCDGMLYKNRNVCVVAEDAEEAVADANFLSEVCGKVYYIPCYDKEPETALNPKIEVVPEKPVRVLGESFVTGLQTEKSDIVCAGVFFIKRAIPLSSILYGLAIQDGSIAVNRQMETNITGVFSAGDCTGAPYQISKAVGEGLIAAQSAVRYLDGWR